MAAILQAHLQHPSDWEGHLDHDGQEGGCIPLVGQHIALQEGVEIKQEQFVDSCDSRYDAHHCQAHFKPLPSGLVQALEQLLCKLLQTRREFGTGQSPGNAGG